MEPGDPAKMEDASIDTRTPDKRVPQWKQFLVICLVNVLVFGVMLVFSDVFSTGPAMIKVLVEFGGYNGGIFTAMCGYAVVLYLLDVSYWTGKCGKVLRRTCFLFIILSMLALGVSLVRTYPYLPLCMFILLLPAIVLIMSATLLSNESSSGAAWTLGSSFFSAGFVSLAIWMAWVWGVFNGGANGNNFWRQNRAEFAEDALCNSTDFNVEGAYLTDDGLKICTAAFLLWSSPLILFGCLLFVSLFLCILGHSLDANPEHSGKQAMRVLAIAAFTCMFGMYSVTSIGGADMDLANAAMSTFFCVLVGILLCGAA